MGVERGIATAEGHQLLVGTQLRNLALMHQHDQIGGTHSAEAVRDEKHSFVSELFLEVLTHGGLRVVIQRTGGFIEHQQIGILQQRAGDGDALALAATETGTPFTQLGAVAIGVVP